MNIKIQKVNSNEIYENTYTLKKLQKTKVFSNKKNIKDIIKGICYFIEKEKIIYEETSENINLSITSYNKRNLILTFNKKIPEKEKPENLNFTLIKSINEHNHRVTSISFFPSGNFISVSCDKTIKIWDSNYNLLQNIEEAHDDYINYVSIKDENNFGTCARDNNIKLWRKKENSFIINDIIKNAHESWVFKIIYLSNDIIFSCSYDKTIKVWEKKNNSYENIKLIKHSNIVYSILLLEDKNYLVSSGEFGTNIYNINSFNCIIEFNEVKCWNWNSLCRLNEDKIIIGGIHGIIKIISLLEKKVIKEINNEFNCWGITIINSRGIFLTCGENKNIKVYKINNYQYIKDINNVHEDDIEGIIQLNNNLILTYSWDKTIKIWEF
jgi:WD40 repeat protein